MPSSRGILWARQPFATGPGGGSGGGDLVVDVTNPPAGSGLTPVVADSVTDQSAAIQAIVDYAHTSRVDPYRRVVIYFPSSLKAYWLTRPVWIDHPNIEIRGDGRDCTVIASHANIKFPCFILGVPRVVNATIDGIPQSFAPTAAHRPDLFGKLDASAAPSAGAKFGFRTMGNSFLQFQASAASDGCIDPVAGYPCLDNWGGTTKLCVEFCVDTPGHAALAPFTNLFGMGDATYEVSPYLCYVEESGNFLSFQFRTSEQGQGMQNSRRRTARIPISGAALPLRVAVQVDLDNAACTAYVNGTQVGVTNGGNLGATDPDPFVPGLKLSENRHYPFMVGNVGASCITQGWTPGASDHDLSFYGLRVSKTVRYGNAGAGQPQKRADAPATAVNDAYAYFTDDASTVFYLPFTDPQTASMLVTCQGGQASYPTPSSGLLMPKPSVGGIQGNAFRDITIEAAPVFGIPVLFGAVLGLDIDDVHFHSGYSGLSSWNMMATYFIRMNRARLGGSDSCFYGYSTAINAVDTEFEGAARFTIHHFGGGGIWDRGIIEQASPRCHGNVLMADSGYGGGIDVRDLLIDFEGATYAAGGAPYEFEACATNGGTVCKIRGGTIGSTGPVPMIRLKDMGPAGPSRLPAVLIVDALLCNPPDPTCVVEVDGPLWRGEVKNVPFFGPPTRVVHKQVWGTTTGVVVREKVTALPTTGSWVKGAHALEVMSPAPGGALEYRCVASGTYPGSPPTWQAVRLS